MFNLKRLGNWAKSSIVSDREELKIYQKIQDLYSGIETKLEQYIKELGFEDERLFVEYKGRKVSLGFIDSLKVTVPYETSLTSEEQAYKIAELTNLYHSKLERIKQRIINLSCLSQDNVFLAYIHSSIEVINSLLKEYAYLLAVQKSAVYAIDGSGNISAAEKYQKLKFCIEIRIAEIERRLTLEELRKNRI